jgi:hypothetical protein
LESSPGNETEKKRFFAFFVGLSLDDPDLVLQA